MVWSNSTALLSALHALTHRIRGITRNPKLYPDAEDFNPGRWIEPTFPTYREPLTKYPNLAGFSQFGFGRRTCQGIPIVEQDLFMTIGGMAWAFDIRKRRNPATGEEQAVHWNEYTPLLIAKPMPFQFDAVPRSGLKLARMRKMYEGVQAESHSRSRSVSRDDSSYPSSSTSVADDSKAPRAPKAKRRRIRIQLRYRYRKAKAAMQSEADSSESEREHFSLAREFQPTVHGTNLAEASSDNDYSGDVETVGSDSPSCDSDAETVVDWDFVEQAPKTGDPDLFSPITEEFPPYVDIWWDIHPELKPDSDQEAQEEKKEQEEPKKQEEPEKKEELEKPEEPEKPEEQEKQETLEEREEREEQHPVQDLDEKQERIRSCSAANFM